MSRRSSLLAKVVPDWSFGPGTSPTVGALVTAAGSMSGAMSAACVGAPWWSVAVGGATVATVAAARAAHDDQPWRVIAYRAGGWLAGTGWATTSVALTAHEMLGSGPWSTTALTTWGAGAGFLAAVGAVLARIQRRADALAAIDHAPTEIDLELDAEDTIAAKWGELVRRVTRIKEISVKGVEMWDTGFGFTLDCDLPLTGITLGDVKAFEYPLATAARLPIGCNVEILPSEVDRAAFLIKVSTKNGLRLNYTPDRDFSVRSIVDPISLGVCLDGVERKITVQYKTTVVIGQKDSGKSTGLNTMMRDIVRCDDDVVIGIDTTGAGSAFAWAVLPFFEGRAAAPAVDYVACDEGSAIDVCAGVRNAIAHRKADYRKRMFNEKTDKIKPARDLPGIVVIVDEYGTLPEKVKAALVDLSDTGRSSGVSVIVCALRAKSPYISRDMIAQAYNRVAYRVSDEAELQMLFDSTWSRGRFDPSSMPYAGVGCVVEGASPADSFKGWMQDPDELDALAIAVADRRPGLDALTEKRFNEAMTVQWSRRWDAAFPLMFPGMTPAKYVPSPDPLPVVQHTTTAVLERTEKVVSMEESQNAMQAAAAAAREAREAADAEYAAELEARASDVDALERLYNASPDVDPRATGSATVKVEAYERVYQLLRDTHPAGLGASELYRALHAEGYPTNRATIQTWLKRDAETNRLDQPKAGGPYVYKPKGGEQGE